MVNLIRSVIDFFRYNHEKWMTISVYIYSAYYRMCIRFVPMPKLENRMGIRGEESPDQETAENLWVAKLVRFHVTRVTRHTPWESKCLVQALTARKILKKKNVNSNLYLGIMKENNELKAHAWLRCGQLYVTGGDGKDFGMVAKFKAF